MIRVASLAFMLLVGAGSAAAQDARLVGVWKPLVYQIQEKEHAMEGLFIFTAAYFSSNVLFNITGGAVDDANANAGPYIADGRRIVFTQWVQIHLRPGDAREPLFLKKGEPEAAEYRFDGDRLQIVFPSGNRFVLQRLGDERGRPAIIPPVR